MKDMEKSITLIGLPGCGKTTVGNLLSHKLKYKFIDMDYYIEEKQGKTPDKHKTSQQSLNL